MPIQDTNTHWTQCGELAAYPRADTPPDYYDDYPDDVEIFQVDCLKDFKFEGFSRSPSPDIETNQPTSTLDLSERDDTKRSINADTTTE